MDTNIAYYIAGVIPIEEYNLSVTLRPKARRVSTVQEHVGISLAKFLVTVSLYKKQAIPP